MFTRAAATLALSLTLAISPAAIAATVAPVGGKVLINRGAGFEPIAQPAVVEAGDKVLLDGGAAARLSFADGCQVPLSAGVVTVIPAESPCIAARGGPAEPAANPWQVSVATAPAEAGISGTTILVGAGAAGLIVGVVAAASKGGSKSGGTPASP